MLTAHLPWGHPERMVRTAKLQDASEVRRLSGQFAPSARWKQSIELFHSEFARIVCDDSFLLAVADKIDGQLTGYLLAQDHGPGLRRSFTVGRIHDLFVQEESRRQGIARELMTAAATWAAERPLPMVLDWQASPTSIEFYRGLGYEPDFRGDFDQYPEFSLDLRGQ